MLKNLLYYFKKRRSIQNPSQHQEFPSSFTTSNINTTTANDLSSDGLTWSQAHPIVVDSHENMIIDGQRYNSGTTRNGFIIKNLGDAWHDNTAINDLSGFGEILVRRSFVLDSNDIIHGYAYYNNEVVLYRRYTITRIGNDIDTINWTRGTDPNLVFCETVSSYCHPVTLQYGNQIVCIVGLTNGGDSQIIAVRATNNNTDQLTDFTNIGFNSTNAIATWLTASYSTLMLDSTQAIDPNPSALVMSDGTIFVAYTQSTVYRFKKVTFNGSAWDTLGSEQTLSNIALAGTDTGYSLKSQLVSKPIQIGTSVFIAEAVWASNVLGDTVRLYKIASDNTVTAINVYSANGIHSYAPTFDISEDNGRILVSYLKTSNGGTYVRMYDTDLNPLMSEALAYNTNDSDIPLLSPQRIDNATMCLFRVAGSPPQIGKQIEIEYS